MTGILDVAAGTSNRQGLRLESHLLELPNSFSLFQRLPLTPQTAVVYPRNLWTGQLPLHNQHDRHGLFLLTRTSYHPHKIIFFLFPLFKPLQTQSLNLSLMFLSSLVTRLFPKIGKLFVCKKDYLNGQLNQSIKN